jgi:ribosomal protein S18 acetylase RimI-like enzyme
VLSGDAALLPEIALSGQSDAMPLPDGYRLVMAAPAVADYLRLRREAGLSPATEAQATLGLPGSWAACHVVLESDGETVGMGRVLGDGGWYFHIVDMAVLPEHQRRGLGDTLLTALLDRIRDGAPSGAYVNLLADPPGRTLYERHGFADTAPDSIGMALRLGGTTNGT